MKRTEMQLLSTVLITALIIQVACLRHAMPKIQTEDKVFSSLEILEYKKVNNESKQLIVTSFQEDSLDLKLELLGTAVGSVKDPTAFIKDLITGRQGIYKRGNFIQEARLIQINTGEVVLEKNGRRKVLRISTRGKVWSKSDKGVPVVLASSKDQIVLSRQGLLNAAKKMPNILRGIKIKPYYQFDKVIGMAVEGVIQDSIIEDVGIRDKDVIMTINNQKIDSYQKALQVASKARNQLEIKVGLSRNGETRTINYRIRN